MKNKLLVIGYQGIGHGMKKSYQLMVISYQAIGHGAEGKAKRVVGEEISMFLKNAFSEHWLHRRSSSAGPESEIW
jgi:hypothetical protein